MNLRQMEIVTDADKLKVDIQQTCMQYKTIKQWAYILHDKDDTRPHYHIYLNFMPNTCDTALVAKWFNLGWTDEDGKEHSGENFIEKVKGRKTDVLLYLTHGNDSQKNKHQYSPSEVHANFDFETEIENSKILGDFEHYSYAQQLQYVNSLPLSEKAQAFTKLEKLWRLRCQVLALNTDRQLQVVFICGRGGTGKTYYAKKLLQNLDYDFCISSSSNDPFQDYMGQKAIILDDLRDKSFEFEDLLTTSVGEAGIHTFTVTFIPRDEKNYEKVTGIKVTVIVNKKKVDSITLPTLNEIVYDENNTLASISLPEGWRWDNPNTVPSVDNNGYKATYTPTDTNNYDYTGLDLNPTLTLKVAQKTPTFTKPIVVANAGQLLEEVKLPELSNGKFVWNNEKESVGEVGTHTFTATFIPNDTTNYKTVSDVEVTVEVGKALPEFEIPTNLTATYQDTLESVKLPEGFTWDNEKQVLSSVGKHTYTATFTPADTNNFAIVTNIEITVQVNKKKGETITIPTLQEITYDENLTLANISLPEGWTWDNPSIVPTVDNNGYKATYTPEDATNYDYSDQNLNPTLTLKVNKKDPVIEKPVKITVPYGTNLENIKLPDGFYLEEVGKLNEIGTFTYKAVYRPSNPNYNSVDDIEITIEVEKANPSVATPNDIILEKENNLVLANIPLPEGWKWKSPDEAVTKTGYYEAIYTPEDSTHYNTITRDVYIEFVEKDSTPATQDKIESPETGDNIINYVILFITSLIGIAGLGYHLKHKN